MLFCFRSNIHPENANSNFHEFKMHTFERITSCYSCHMLLRWEASYYSLSLTHTHTHTHTHTGSSTQISSRLSSNIKTEGWDVDPLPSSNHRDSFERPPLLPLPLRCTLTIYSSLSFYSSLPLHMCLPRHKVSFEIRWMVSPRRSAPHGLSHIGNDWVVLPTEDGKEKCLSHFSTSSRRWTGERGQGYCTVNIQSRAPKFTRRFFFFFSQDKI